MAVVLGICDSDSRRRDEVRARLPESLSGLSHLIRRSISAPGLDIYWEASASAPTSTATAQVECRRTAWILGDFDAAYTKSSDAAERLLLRVTGPSADLGYISGQNGYYLAVLFDQTPRLVLGTDSLGLFPLYYWAKGDVCLFGTSPELFKHHPSFVAKPSMYAIASVLLVNHITSGRSLFEHVRRNRPGHYVEWTPKTGPRETEANTIRPSDKSFGASYAACVGQVSGCFDAFHERLRSLPNVDVFLSGGQDSRLVAGFANRHISRKAVRAVSLGGAHDQELQYAKKVARVFGWRHRHRDVEFERYADFATCQLKMESLQGPFASFDTRSALPILGERGGAFLSGYLGDAVMGDRHIRAALSPQSGLFGFDEMFGTLNRYGFAANDVARLLAGNDGDRVTADVIDGMRDQWNDIHALPFQKAWLFQLNNRQRFHVGSIIWRLSLGAWPLLPYYDRNLVDAVISMPLDYLRERRMQVDIIKREFPRLATLPLDRNAVGPEYLVTPLYRKFLPPISDVSWKLYRLIEQNRERRYYHRTYDFNARGWRSVRRDADRYRQGARNLFRAEVLDSLLPSAEVTPHYANAVQDASKTKSLIGLVMWYGMNFG